LTLNKFPHNPGTPGGPNNSGETIVDGLTLKDYYDLRDLRLFLWGLEKELIGKYGVVEAEPLASKVRYLIKKNIEQITNKIDSTPEHHSPLSEENASSEIRCPKCGSDQVFKDEGQQNLYWCPKCGFGGGKSAFTSDKGKPPDNHSSGNSGEQLERCVICGYEGTKEKDQHGNYIFYWGNEPICMACREDHSMELDAGIKPSSLKGKSEARHSNPGEHHVTREEAEAEISVLIDNLTAAIKKGGEIPPELRQALVKNFLFFKSNPGFPSTYTDFENWLKKDMNMTVEQFKALEQPRKDVIYSLFRGAWENNSLPPSWKQTESQHPSVSTGNPDGKKRRYKPTTYTIPKYAITKDNVAFSFKEKIRKQYNPDIDGEEEETTIEVSADYNNKNYGFNVRNLFDFGLAVNPKGETSTANGLSGGLPMNVEEFMKSNRYLAWSPERELTREEQEQVFRKEHPTETGYGWDRGSLEGQKWVSMTKDEVHVYEALLKTLPEYMHEVRMGGNPDGKFKVRFNEGTEKQEDMTLPASSPEAATIEASRKYFESYKEYPKTARIVSHHLSAGNPDEKMLRMPSPETEQRKAARLSKERHSGGI
jgi:predicted RNA-binding Zn-ribbon protein involved in translation (DUF1610 family)